MHGNMMCIDCVDNADCFNEISYCLPPALLLVTLAAEQACLLVPVIHNAVPHLQLFR